MWPNMAHLREFLRDYDKLVSDLRDFPNKETIFVATDIAGENIKHAQHVTGFLADKIARVSSRAVAHASTSLHSHSHAHSHVACALAGVCWGGRRLQSWYRLVPVPHSQRACVSSQIRPAHAPIEA